MTVAHKVDEPEFDAWVKRLFDHPIQPDWYLGIDRDTDSLPGECVVPYLAQLFRDPLPALAPYTAEQAAQGLWTLAMDLSHSSLVWVFEPEISWTARRDCIRAIPRLFSALLEQRCSEALSHLSKGSENPLNVVCYMWWDLLSHHRRADDLLLADQDRELLEAMEQILSLDSMACQESALHGLGHWHQYCPGEVEAAVDRFLEAHPRLRPELRRYALSARTGCVL